MTGIGTLDAVIIDTPDPDALAAFYSGLAGWTVVDQNNEDGWVTTTTPDGWTIAFQLAPDHVPPRWPDQAHPQQAHLDLLVGDLAEPSARAIELGARSLHRAEDLHVLADPSGHPFCLCLKKGVEGIKLFSVTIDCPDAKALAEFYSQILGRPVIFAEGGWAQVGPEGEHPLLFQQVEGYCPPRWPDPAHPQQYHLDVLVGDLATADQAARAAGANPLKDHDTWKVYADPAGKPFCLVTTPTWSPTGG